MKRVTDKVVMQTWDRVQACVAKGISMGTAISAEAALWSTNESDRQALRAELLTLSKVFS